MNPHDPPVNGQNGYTSMCHPWAGMLSFFFLSFAFIPDISFLIRFVSSLLLLFNFISVFNFCCAGGITRWLSENILGIRPTSLGFKKYDVIPCIPKTKRDQRRKERIGY